MKKIEALAGDEIRSTILKAILGAQTGGGAAYFDFNGVTVVVSASSDADLIYRDWNRGLNGYLGENPMVGPHPAPELSDAEKASDAEIEAENEKRRAERQAEYDKQSKAKAIALKGALSIAGPLELSDAESWQKCVDANQDGYGGRVVRYAEEWGRLMQTRISNGETISECAEELSRLADDDGITGFMYGAAVSMLIGCWKHGEELRLWRDQEK